jgi:hypothetical protein
MVRAGSGQYSVGTPEEKSPTQAGISKESPTIIVNKREFISTPLRSLHAAERFQRLYNLLCPLRHLVIAQGAFG